jgi:hypothetical protein
MNSSNRNHLNSSSSRRIHLKSLSQVSRHLYCDWVHRNSVCLQAPIPSNKLVSSSTLSLGHVYCAHFLSFLRHCFLKPPIFVSPLDLKVEVYAEASELLNFAWPGWEFLDLPVILTWGWGQRKMLWYNNCHRAEPQNSNDFSWYTKLVLITSVVILGTSLYVKSSNDAMFNTQWSILSKTRILWFTNIYFLIIFWIINHFLGGLFHFSYILYAKYFKIYIIW